MTNQKTFFIIHGAEGHSKENWFPWLKSELEKAGHQVITPDFPTPENQTLENWIEVLKKHKDLITENTTFIGHSLGVAFTLKVIEHHQIDSAYLIASFFEPSGNRFDEGLKVFGNGEYNWEKIKSNCQNFHIYHADNDPYLPLEKGERLAQKLNTTINIIPNAGHFNSAAGYEKFEKLLEDIQTSQP